MNLKKTILRCATAISPALNDNLRFFALHKRLPSRKNPKTFEEKLLVLKEGCYANNSTVIKCADKHRVREYVIEKGCGRYLNEQFACYDIGESIDWDALPNEFAMKLNTGCGRNYICRNKQTQLSEAKNTAARWQHYDHSWLDTAEMHYERIKPKIVFEKYIDLESNEEAEDYKVYCFNGNPMAVLVMADRLTEKGVSARFMSPQWKFLGVPKKYEGRQSRHNIQRPVCLDEMIEVAHTLSEGFPFVRVDFFIANDVLIFGEMTFTPCSGLGVSEIDIDGKTMGELLSLSK